MLPFDVILAEFRSAVAAARRYDDLKYRRTQSWKAGASAADIPRLVFEEFYLLADRAGPRHGCSIPPSPLILAAGR